MASTSATTALPDDLEAPHDAWLVIGASSLGTVFEWYDFYLYGLLAVIISAQFFSGVNETTSFIFALAAFAARQASGRGQEVDVAIYEAVAALMESTMADYERGGVLRTRTGSILPGVAPSNVYTCADGADIVIAANADAVFRRLSQAMGRDELASEIAKSKATLRRWW